MPVWMRTFRQARQSLAAVLWMIESSRRGAAVSQRCAHRRRAAQSLHSAAAILARARKRLLTGANAMLETKDRLAGAHPELIEELNQWWLDVALQLARLDGEIFLQQRDLRRPEPRIIDRIAPLVRRRRRTPRPAALTVPQRSLLGRAPPLSPVCTL